MQNRRVDSGDADAVDPAVERVIAELRTLRRAQLRTSYDFSRAPTILWHLGRGNVDVASAFFRELPRMGSLHIDAAIASLGFGPDVVNVEDRMSEFALRVGAESTRTVRRWTDQGFRLIAQMILDWSAEEGHDRPLIEVAVEPQGPDAVLIELSCILPSGITMIRPEIRSSQGVVPWLDDPLEGDELDPPLVFKARAVVDFLDGDRVGRFVEVVWLGNAEAYYQVEMLPGVMQAHKAIISNTKKGCELRWQALVPPENAISF